MTRAKSASGANATETKQKKTLQQRVDDWDVSPVVLNNLINLIIALLVLFVLLAVAYFTLSVKRHLVSLVMFPLLTYVIFSLPSFNLRMRENPSTLIITDIVAVVNIALLSLYLDSSLYAQDSNLLLKAVFCLFGVMMFSAYLARGYYLFYITPFFAPIYNLFFMWMYGVEVLWMAVIAVVLFFLFLRGIWYHKFYFGIGRVCIDDKYVEMPELKAAYIRKEQKKAAKAKREAEIEAQIRARQNR
jgi:hypothetical protein